MRASATGFAFLSAALFCFSAFSQFADPQTALASAFVKQMAAGDYKAASKVFDKDVAAHLPPESLRELWATLEVQCGEFERQLSVRKEKIKGFDIAIARCQFERKDVDVRLTIDATGKVSGIYFAADQIPKFHPTEFTPDYIRKTRFKELEATVGSGEGKLSGTLSMPLGDGPFPALVLVHGSGHQDRDETIGPAKPFRDLAWGLASKKIAVLRYDKRAFAKTQDSITVKEETIDDALEAVALLRKTPGIDPKRIFILGHSLGAMLVPRIGQRDSGIAGFILLAAPGRPLEDLILEQCERIAASTKGHEELKKAQLEALRKQIELVKSPELSKDTPSAMLPLGVPPGYWLDLRGYKPAKEGASLKCPLLALQGEDDSQVTMRDFEIWKNALAEKSDATFKSYPELTHLFMRGGFDAQNGAGGHVAEAVVKDISEWISQSGK